MQVGRGCTPRLYPPVDHGTSAKLCTGPCIPARVLGKSPQIQGHDPNVSARKPRPKNVPSDHDESSLQYTDP